jgi:hypothetical protein
MSISLSSALKTPSLQNLRFLFICAAMMTIRSKQPSNQERERDSVSVSGRRDEMLKTSFLHSTVPCSSNDRGGTTHPRERERERERTEGTQHGRTPDGWGTQIFLQVCVCVCVCERDIERTQECWVPSWVDCVCG